MSSCIAPFYIAAFVLLAGAQESPDDLYRNRDTLASATRATTIWSERLAANPKDFESAWKLARARYWLGTNGLPVAQRKAALEAGIEAGRTAISVNSARPEGGPDATPSGLESYARNGSTSGQADPA